MRLVNEGNDPGGDNDENGGNVNEIGVEGQISVQLKVNLDARERT